MIVSLLFPPALTFALALALHMFAKEKAERVALLPAAIGILAAWAFIVRPGLFPVDDVRRVVHVAAGAAILGLALDAVRPHRAVVIILALVFVLGGALASVTGTLMPSASVSAAQAVTAGVLAIIALLALARLDAMRADSLGLMILLTLVAFGLSVLAAIAQDTVLTGLAFTLATASAGYLIFVAITGAAASDGLILVAGAPMLAVVWALAQRHPDLRLALLCLPLVLFADATARRAPLPAARISALLYPLILAVLVSLPLALAALISFVTSGP